MSAGPVLGEPGEYKTILGPMTFAHLSSQIGSFSSAFYVDAGLSFLTNKVGQKIASDRFTLYDDASMQNVYGSSPFDAEGLPTRRTPIIENGVLKGYLHNSSTAKKFNTSSTANAGLIAPHPFNLVISPGERTLDEMISQIDDGMLVTNDWYLRYQNYGTGDFSTIPRDAMFRIKNGQIAGPVKDLRISENILGIVKNIEAMTRERKWVKWWEVDMPTLAPTALVSKVKFTSITNVNRVLCVYQGHRPSLLWTVFISFSCMVLPYCQT